MCAEEKPGGLKEMKDWDWGDKGSILSSVTNWQEYILFFWSKCLWVTSVLQEKVQEAGPVHQRVPYELRCVATESIITEIIFESWFLIPGFP